MNAKQDFLENIGRFYLRNSTFNEIITLGSELNNDDLFLGSKITDLLFAIETINLPYTIVYTPTSAKVKEIANKVNGLSEIDEADAFILIFDRTVLGTHETNIKGIIAIDHDGDAKGGAADQATSQYIHAFFRIAVLLNNFLSGNPIYAKYKKINVETSGILLTVQDNTMEGTAVSGKDRPDLACRDVLSPPYLFASEKPIVTARPYADELMNDLKNEMLSLEEKNELAENGDENMMEKLADLYLNGDDEVAQNFKKSAYWWEKLANTGNATGQFNIGLYYAKGCGVKRDFKKAAEWMKKSAENGDDDAPNAAAMYDGAAEKLKKAESGDPAAQAEVAKLYTQLGGSLEQFGTQSDYKEAFKWAKKAADQGDLEGLYCLALCYEHGRGTAVAKTKAAATYEKAAKMGHAPSQWNLAVCYLEGSGYERDEVKGYMWAYQAADQGNELAINALTNQDKTLDQIIDTYKNPETNVTLEGTQYEGRADRCENFRTGTELTYKITKDRDGDEVIELFYNGGTVGLLSKWNSAALLPLLKLDRIKLGVKVKSCIPKSKRGARARIADVHLNLIISEKKPETPEERKKRLAEEERRRKEEKERKRLEAEAKKKAEEERKRLEAEAKKKAEEAQRAWEAEVASIKEKRQADWKNFAEAIDKETEAKIKALEAERDKDLDETREAIKKAESEIKFANDELATLGFFKTGRKKELKTKMEAIGMKIHELNASLTKISEQYSRDIRGVSDSAEALKSSYQKELDKKYKLPPNPGNKK